MDKRLFEVVETLKVTYSPGHYIMSSAFMKSHVQSFINHHCVKRVKPFKSLRIRNSELALVLVQSSGSDGDDPDFLRSPLTLIFVGPAYNIYNI